MAGTTSVLVAGHPSGGRLEDQGHVVVDHGGTLCPAVDGSLVATFASAFDSVQAGIALQQAFVTPGPTGLHIGIDIGEVLAGDDESLATTIGLARRLCGRAGAGQIVVSGLVRHLVGARGGYRFVAVDGGDEAWRIEWGDPERVPIRVVLADDAALIRDGIERLLVAEGYDVVATAADLDGLLAAVDATRPDLVITDIRMPPDHSDEGLRAARRIRDTHPTTGVLLVSNHVETGVAGDLLDGTAGGIGYVLKEQITHIDAFLEAARTVASGGTVIDPTVSDRLLHRRRNDAAMQRLTDRERDVLAVMAQGKSNAAIAAALVLGLKTVEFHVRSILTKLDLAENPDENRRVQAVVRWLESQG